MRKLMAPSHAFGILMVLPSLFLASGCSFQRAFPTPDLAVSTLVDALRERRRAIAQILGPSESDVLYSGDAVSDQNSVERFLSAYDEKHTLVPAEEGVMTLVVGNNDWPMPIPIVRDVDKDAWRFDTAAGKDEIISRRVGANELDTIQICAAIADAQREYAMTDPEHAGMPVYAQKFLSSPGQKNGLYWPTDEGAPPSPLGSLVAVAEDAGYNLKNRTGSKPTPYHGYVYRILTAQGANAAGGARDYMVNGKLVGGFAIVAYPAEYGKSGVVTFIMNQDGIVYQRDLGDSTRKVATAMHAFDPSPAWKKVDSAK